MATQNPSHGVPDIVLAGGLVAAPAWAAWLTEFNELLSTLSMLVGLTFGILRLWYFLRSCRGSVKGER